MTSHTDRMFLLSRVPFKVRAKYKSVTSLISYFLSTTVISQPRWFLLGLKTSMQTVGVNALCYLTARASAEGKY